MNSETTLKTIARRTDCQGVFKTLASTSGTCDQWVNAAVEQFHEYSAEVLVRDFVAEYQLALNGGVF